MGDSFWYQIISPNLTMGYPATFCFILEKGQIVTTKSPCASTMLVHQVSFSLLTQLFMDWKSGEQILFIKHTFPHVYRRHVLNCFWVCPHDLFWLVKYFQKWNQTISALGSERVIGLLLASPPLPKIRYPKGRFGKHSCPHYLTHLCSGEESIDGKQFTFFSKKNIVKSYSLKFFQWNDKILLETSAPTCIVGTLDYFLLGMLFDNAGGTG